MGDFMFYIGNTKIKNNIVLAPMAGISNPAYMKICEEMQVGYAITELISAEAVVRNNKKTLEMLKGIEKLNIPVAVQIFGSNKDTMARAASIIVSLYKNVFIDINMGCPVPKVAVRSSSGSALLKDPDQVREIVTEVVKSVNVPVTVKIRSGWDNNSINALEIAKIIEESGAKAITLHPRTRQQGYSGKSDWSIIKEVKANINIPVIGNGDVLTCHDAKKMIEYTNCDAVMIGRALLGNPWLIKECIDYIEENKEPIKVQVEEKINMIKKHAKYLEEIKGEKIATLEMRSHATWYLKGLENTSKIKQKITSIKSLEELNEILDKYMEEYNASNI